MQMGPICAFLPILQAPRPASTRTYIGIWTTLLLSVIFVVVKFDISAIARLPSTRVGELTANAIAKAEVCPEHSATELRDWSKQPVSKVKLVRSAHCCSAASEGPRVTPLIGCFWNGRLGIVDMERAIGRDRGGGVRSLNFLIVVVLLRLGRPDISKSERGHRCYLQFRRRLAESPPSTRGRTRSE
jgi:hypothetical protein